MKKLLALFLVLCSFAAFSGQGVALVIANEWYADEALAGAGKDGEKIAKALKESGYKVFLLKNVNKKEIEDQLNKLFQEKTENLVIYYTGHGVELKERGFFWLPVESSIQGLNKDNVVEDGIRLMDVVLNFEKLNTFNNVFIFNDACRTYVKDDNDIKRTDSVTRKGKNILTSFATSKGNPAVDSNELTGESGSLYASYLEESIKGKRSIGKTLEYINENLWLKSKQKAEFKWISIDEDIGFNYSNNGDLIVFDGMDKWKK